MRQRKRGNTGTRAPIVYIIPEKERSAVTVRAQHDIPHD